MELSYQCPICLDTLTEPMLVTCCGQSFCRACLDAALATTDACPMCRRPLLSGSHTMTQNRTLEALLARLKVGGRGDDMDQEGDVLLSIIVEHAQDTDVMRPHGGGCHSWVKRVGALVTPRLSDTTPVAASVRLGQWRHWCRIHWATLQCVFYVFLFGVVVFFLRVQEEEFAEHESQGR